MAKGDDTVAKKKNKKIRKKQNKKTDKATVSARVAAIIATKKRRQSGKRRQCQGMCFSLPTLDDPFNDRKGKPEVKPNNYKKNVPSESNKKVSAKEKGVGPNKGSSNKIHADEDQLEKINEKIRSLKNKKKKKKSAASDNNLKKIEDFENSCYPSKFLIMCLNEIENGFRSGGIYSSEDEKHVFDHSWGIEFFKSYSGGNNILGTDGESAATIEQIAWIASTAADTIARKEKDGLLLSGPFLLYIVPSQEKAAKVRLVCKHLKAIGVHSVSLHPGASLDHQISGLKSCEPEFLVSTPERLLELFSLKAVDISAVSLLVIDGMQSLIEGGYLDNVTFITQSVAEKCCTVVFNDGFSHTAVDAAESLLEGPTVCRLSTEADP